MKLSKNHDKSKIQYYVNGVGPFDNYESVSAEWCRQYLKKIHKNKRGKRYKIQATTHPFADRHNKQELAWSETDWSLAPSF